MEKIWGCRLHDPNQLYFGLSVPPAVGGIHFYPAAFDQKEFY
jgi:hypothetical protein